VRARTWASDWRSESLARSLWVRLISTGSEGVSNGIDHLPTVIRVDVQALAIGQSQLRA